MTVADLIEAISGDIASRLQDARVYMRGSLPWVLARALAGICADIYAHLDIMRQQITPLTAYGEQLDAWGSVWGCYRRQATSAWGMLWLQGSPGTEVPAGTRWTDRRGHYWASRTDEVLGDGGAVVVVWAERAGADHVATPGAVLECASTIDGLDPHAIVLADPMGIVQSQDGYCRGYVLIEATAPMVLPASTIVVRPDGLRYRTASTEIWSHPAPRAVYVESEQQGEAYETPPGRYLRIVSPPPGILSSCRVMHVGLAYGEDGEEDEPYRRRLIATIRRPPVYASLSMYERWALETPGVPVLTAAAYAWPDYGVHGRVYVAFTVDRGDGRPTTSERAEVGDYLAARAPAGVEVVVQSLAAMTVPMEITLSAKPGYTVEQAQEAVAGAVSRALRSVRPGPHGGQVYGADLHRVLSGVPEVAWYILDLGSDPIYYGAWQLPVASITWL